MSGIFRDSTKLANFLAWVRLPGWYLPYMSRGGAVSPLSCNWIFLKISRTFKTVTWTTRTEPEFPLRKCHQFTLIIAVNHFFYLKTLPEMTVGFDRIVFILGAATLPFLKTMMIYVFYKRNKYIILMAVGCFKIFTWLFIGEAAFFLIKTYLFPSVLRVLVPVTCANK